ncbi:MAG: protein kinase [Chthoniobacterales bacterium]
MISKTTFRSQGKIDPQHWARLKNILADALELPSEEAQTAFLEERCAHDAVLRAEAESLIREAHALSEQPTDFLEDCAEHATRTLWQEEPSAHGWRIGAYEVVRELGRGGMGAVYLATRADGQFEKEVAIKVLKRGTDTDEVLRRFAGEKHILARLDHANIARLLDAGTTDDGLPYFVMEHVAGSPVTRFVLEQNLSLEERLGVFLKICTAVEVAHHNHVIHRDLKPGNILVNAEGEPKLLDFGIAKLLSAEGGLDITATAEQRLTPICASPEQTDGRPVTEASDVYALGALLYELLTGKHPQVFPNARPSSEEIARVVREQEPERPSARVSNRQTARWLRGDLDAIVLHALRKNPKMRYAKVADLAADVRRHLAHEPVLARRPTVAYRFRCLVRRPAFRVAAAAAVLLLLGAGGFSLWQRAGTVAVSPPELGLPPDARKSIAVLPFETLGDDNPPAYFADGVQDNILTDLGRVGDLKVISRSGVAAFRGKSRNLKEIGRALGVRNVLEGSVQVSGDRVRVNAQLIDTQTDTQIWAEHYDRKVEDIFALQSELSQTIAAQLKATLSSGEKAKILKKPTEDLQAYDLYLRARAALRDPLQMDQHYDWSTAVSLLQEAIARDPKFTLAYCLLNEAHVYMYRFGEEHSPQDLTAAKEAAEAALRLEPDLEEARLALARYYYYGLSDYRQTEKELSRIPGSVAHEIEFFTLASLAERRLGQWEESIRDGEKAVELDPQAPALAVNLIQTYSGLRRFQESERLADAMAKRLGDATTTRLWMVKSEAAMGSGDFEKAEAALAATHNKDDANFQFARLLFKVMKGDRLDTKALTANASEELKKMASFWTVLGMSAHARGDEEESHRLFLEAKNVAQALLARRPDDPDYLSDLSVAEAGLGEKEEAILHARRAAEVRPMSSDALTGPTFQVRLAEVYVMTGDQDSALEILNEVVKRPFSVNYGELKFNPGWAPLRDDPRFAPILEQSRLPVPIDR